MHWQSQFCIQIDLFNKSAVLCRSYYRCTNPRCNAKKQVERSTDEPDTLVVTYEGLHLHYTYSHFLHHQQPPPQPKKPKLGAGPPQQPIVVHDDDLLHGPAQQDIITTGPLGAAVMAPAPAPAPPPPASFCYDLDDDVPAFFDDHDHHHHQQQHITNGGLLEDMVPLLVRRPCTTTTTSAGSTSPDLSASSSVSWNPTSPYIDMAILSNIF